MLDQTLATYNNISGLLVAIQSPIGSLASAQANLRELHRHRQDYVGGFQKASAGEKALVYTEYTSNLLQTIVTGAALARQGVAIAEQGISTANLIALSPHLSPLMAVAGIFASASLTLKEFREYRSKRLELEDLNLLLEALKKELNEKYADCIQHLGNYERDEDEIKQQITWAKQQLNEHKPLAEILIELEKKDLAALIAYQAYAAYHDNNKIMSLVEIYQFAIDEKIRQLKLSQTETQKIRQFVIAQQHLQHLATAAPILKKNQRHQLLRILVGVVCVGIAVAVALASLGILSPAVGIAFVSSGVLVNLILSQHKAYLVEQQQAVNQVKAPLQAQVENFLLPDGQELTASYANYDSFAEVTAELEAFIRERNDQLSQPLFRLLNMAEFLNADDVEKLYHIKYAAENAKNSVSRWKRFSLESHELYQLINNLDFKDVDECKRLIQQYKEKRLAQTQKFSRRQQVAQASLRADAKLSTTIKIDTITEEQCQELMTSMSPTL